MMIDDLTSDGMVRRWSLVDGAPACLADAVPASHPDARTALAVNAALRELLSAEEPPEDAQAWIAARAVALLEEVSLPVPASVALWQARAALSAAGLLEQVDAVVEAAGSAAQAVFQYGNFVQRSSPVLAALALQLTPPLSPDQVDDLFRAAAAIDA